MINRKEAHDQMCNFIGRKNTFTTAQNIEKIKDFIDSGALIDERSPFDKHNKDYPINLAVKHSLNMLEAVISFNPVVNNVFPLFIATEENNAVAFETLMKYFTHSYHQKNTLIDDIKNMRYLAFNGKQLLDVYSLAVIQNNTNIISQLNKIGITANDIKPESLSMIVSNAIQTCNVQQTKTFLPLLFKHYSGHEVIDAHRFFIKPLYDLSLTQFKPFLKDIFDSLPKNDKLFLFNLAQNLIDKSSLAHFAVFKELYVKKTGQHNLNEKVSTINAFVTLFEQKKLNKISKIIEKGISPTIRTEYLTTSDKEKTSLFSVWYMAQKNNSRKNYNEEFRQIFEKNPDSESIFFIPKNDIYFSDDKPAVRQVNIISAIFDLYERGITNPLSLFLDKELSFNIKNHNVIKSIMYSNRALDDNDDVKNDIEKIITNFEGFNDEESYLIFDYYPDLFLKLKEKQEINSEYFAEQYVKKMSALFKPKSHSSVEWQIKEMERHFHDNIFSPELVLEKFETLNVDMVQKKHLQNIFYPLLEKNILQKNMRSPENKRKIERI